MVMEWLILLLLIPLVLFPIICLAGFAGCRFEPRAASPDPPLDPSDFVAAPMGENIQLTWKDNGTNTTHFRIKRTQAGAEPGHAIIFIENIPATPGMPPIANTSTDSIGLMPATTYEYQLFAVAVYVESTGVVLAHATTLP